jgi:putative DNA primase/helicase
MSDHRLSSSAQQSLRKPSFLRWLQQQDLHDWRVLLSLAHAQISTMAAVAGIDWATLSLQLSQPATLLKGSGLAVLSPKDKGRCAFVWYLHQDAYGQAWPCLVFMSFRHGGIQQVFHARRWAWERFQLGGLPLRAEPPQVPRFSSVPSQAAAAQQRWRHARFELQLQRWQRAAPAKISHCLLVERLCGHATAALLARLDLRQWASSFDNHLLVALRHREHGLTGFQQLHTRPLNITGRTQNLFIRAEGLKRGSFVCIRAQQGCEHWPVGLCEGLLTGLSIALGWPGPIAVALDAYNLGAVRAGIQRRCVFFADDDTWSSRNTGRLQADAARLPDDSLLAPSFGAQHDKHRPNDFNDVLKLAGVAELQRQIRRVWPTETTQP